MRQILKSNLDDVASLEAEVDSVTGTADPSIGGSGEDENNETVDQSVVATIFKALAGSLHAWYTFTKVLWLIFPAMLFLLSYVSFLKDFDIFELSPVIVLYSLATHISVSFLSTLIIMPGVVFLYPRIRMLYSRAKTINRIKKINYLILHQFRKPL